VKERRGERVAVGCSLLLRRDKEKERSGERVAVGCSLLLRRDKAKERRGERVAAGCSLLLRDCLRTLRILAETCTGRRGMCHMTPARTNIQRVAVEMRAQVSLHVETPVLLPGFNQNWDVLKILIEPLNVR
jgi:hypothetical protein